MYFQHRSYFFCCHKVLFLYLIGYLNKLLFFIICDYNISVSLSNKTDIGDFFQKYGNIISHCVYIVAGICVFKGLRKKGEKYKLLANGMLAFSSFWTFYSFLDTSGKYLREDCRF